MREKVYTWFSDFWELFTMELKAIFTDGGMIIIFFLGGLGYPLLYNVLYFNGVAHDTEVAVVDLSNGSESRRYIREVNSTREIDIVAKCVSMEDAIRLMKERKIHGIIYIPEDFDRKIANLETGKISIYSDMSNFLYYKNVLMGTNVVMLNEIHRIEIERFNALGNTEKQSEIMAMPTIYDENEPYNNSSSYTIFFISAALLIVIQQTMLYGMSLRAGKLRENGISYADWAQHFKGPLMGRIVLGRAQAYFTVYLGIGIYTAFIVPAMFNFPQRGDFWEILYVLAIFIMDCVLFCSFWTSLFHHRESLIVVLLFISPVAIFLTGFSWPVTAIPRVWRWFSCILPSTFGCRAFINMNTAGGSLSIVREPIQWMLVQSLVYYFAYSTALILEKRKALKLKQQGITDAGI